MDGSRVSLSSSFKDDMQRGTSSPTRRHYDDDRSARRHESHSNRGYGKHDRDGTYVNHDRDRGYEKVDRDQRRPYREEGPRDRHRPHARETSRRSRSPDFARDRARERQAYDRQHQSPPEDAAGPSFEPDFKLSGLLAQESNSKNGVGLKYFEPPEARKPKKKWRLYVFKDGKELDLFHIARQSCYLIGRDRAVADIPVDHPSISKQHAVIQYRFTSERNEFGDEKQSIRPFLIDLESANGCTVNREEVPPSRYFELRNGDTIRFGGSQREYVLLLEE